VDLDSLTWTKDNSLFAVEQSYTRPINNAWLKNGTVMQIAFEMNLDAIEL
jgi:hypothetical protein